MTSRNSFSKAGLICEILKRNIWAFVISFLGFFFSLTLPLAMEIQNLDRAEFSTPLRKQQMLADTIPRIIGTSNPFVKLVMIALAVVCAVVIFSYLHSRQRTDFYHSLPVRRGTIFACHYLAGVILVLPAYFIMLAISVVMALASGGAAALVGAHLGITVLTHLVFFFAVYALASVCTILCGNTIVSLLLFGWSAFSFSAAPLLWDGIKSVFYRTYGGTSELVQILVARLSPILQYLTIMPGNRDSSTAWITNWSGNNNNLTAALVQYAIIAILLTVLAYFLFRYRKSEAAGTAIAFSGIKAPLKFWCCTIMALGAGIMLYQIGNSARIWLVVGFLLGGVLTHFLMEIIYGFDFRAIFTHWKSLLIYSIVFAGVIIGINADVTGYDKYLPDADSVAAVSIDYSGYDGQGGSAQYSRGNQEPDLSDRETVAVALQLAQKGIEARDTEQEEHYNRVVVTYAMTNGGQISRQYRIPYSEENDLLYDKIRFSKEFIEKRSPAFEFIPTGNDRMYIATSHDSNLGTVTTQNKEAVEAILEAVREDTLELSQQISSSDAPVIRLSLVSVGEAEEEYPGLGYITDSAMQHTVGVYANFTKTLAAIEKFTGAKPAKLTVSDASSAELKLYETDSEGLHRGKIETVTDPLDIAILLENAITGAEVDAADMGLKLEGYVLQESGFEVTVRLKNGEVIALYYPENKQPNEIFAKYLG